MSQKPKKVGRRSSSFLKKEANKSEIPRPSKIKEEPIEVENRKDTVMRELLYSLLSLCTSECEIHKDFAKLKFLNDNSYSGWLGPNGFQGFGNYQYAGLASYRGLVHVFLDDIHTYGLMIGSFDKSLPKNLGRYVYENENVYEGEFLAGKRHGYGLYKTNRFQYTGNFKNGSFHGEGVLKSKKREQKGTFNDGVLVKGVVYEPAGVYSGSFDESALRKNGKYTFTNGNTYNGHWMDDLFFGYGVYNWVEETAPYTVAETRYTGYWMRGEQHALGMLLVRRRCLISQWCQGKKIGAGVIFAINGNCYAGRELFEGRSYRQGFKIRHCLESKTIIKDIMKLLAPTITYDMDEKSEAFKELVQKLILDCGELPSPVNPIRIPHYELGNTAPDFCSSRTDVMHLQQVLSENFKEFMHLYGSYIHPGDDYLNFLGLNLLYLDVFQRVRDVNIVECMNNSINTISNLVLSNEDVITWTPLTPIPFYTFFQHIVYITKVLMQNENLRVTVEQIKPTYFSTLAMQVIVVLRMLMSDRKPKLVVREALLISRTAVISLIQSIEKKSNGHHNIRSAYRFLKTIGAVEGKSLNFIKAVETCYDNVFKDGRLRKTEFKMSNLELVEIVLCTCHLKLEMQQRALNKLILRQSAKAITSI